MDRLLAGSWFFVSQAQESSTFFFCETVTAISKTFTASVEFTIIMARLSIDKAISGGQKDGHPQHADPKRNRADAGGSLSRFRVGRDAATTQTK